MGLPLRVYYRVCVIHYTESTTTEKKIISISKKKVDLFILGRLTSIDFFFISTLDFDSWYLFLASVTLDLRSLPSASNLANSLSRNSLYAVLPSKRWDRRSSSGTLLGRLRQQIDSQTNQNYIQFQTKNEQLNRILFSWDTWMEQTVFYNFATSRRLYTV